jgi:cyclophilin family peptidyl-prolyl cis-trans isomerase
MGDADFVSCPECGALVKESNLKRHMSRAHSIQPEAREDRSRPRPNRTLRRLRRYRYRLAGAALIIIIGIVAATYLPEISWNTTKENDELGLPIAIVETSLGTFTIELDTENAPVTAGNFISLAKRGFYNNLTFHRVARDFVIQGGDPNGDGTGGSGTPLPWENTTLRNRRYSVAMARAGDPNNPQYTDTGSSQFFINLDDNIGLDNFAFPFAVFGQVVDGYGVVDRIGRLYPTEGQNDGPPTQTVRMNITIED